MKGRNEYRGAHRIHDTSSIPDSMECNYNLITFCAGGLNVAYAWWRHTEGRCIYVVALYMKNRMNGSTW